MILTTKHKRQLSVC